MEKMENGEDKDRIEGRNAEEGQEGDCCYKKKERKEKEYKDLVHRLNRIEGQIRGIKGMVQIFSSRLRR